MKILIAPNAFKGSLNATDAANIIAHSFQEVDSSLECRLLPVADGGDGTAQVLAKGLNAQKIECFVKDPLGTPIKAPFYLTEDGTALIELADAAGIRLLSSRERAPLQTNTYGVGQLVLEALKRDCRKIILGVGGSASLDVGMGMLRALGVRFLNFAGAEVIGGGGALERITSIDVSKLDARLAEVEFLVACDVENQLLGPKGAARVFGPQKGANPLQVELLDRNHRKFAQLVSQEMGVDMTTMTYGGAAGGVSAGLKAFCNAELRAGADLILDTLNFEESLNWADLVITGEGRIDEQSQYGKAPYVVAQRAQLAGKPVIGLAGSVGPLVDSPFSAVFSIQNEPSTLKEAMGNAEKNLQFKARELARLLLTFSKK